VLTPTTVTSIPWLDHLLSFLSTVPTFAHGAGKLLGTDPLLTAAVTSDHDHYGSVHGAQFRSCGQPESHRTVAAVALFAPLGTLLTGLAAYSFGRIVAGLFAACLQLFCALRSQNRPSTCSTIAEISYFFFQQVAGTGAFGTALLAHGVGVFAYEGVAKQLPPIHFSRALRGAVCRLFKSQVFLTYSFGLLLFCHSDFSPPRHSIADCSGQYWRRRCSLVA